MIKSTNIGMSYNAFLRLFYKSGVQIGKMLRINMSSIAHTKNPQGKRQDLEEHLRNVAEAAERYCASFGGATLARFGQGNRPVGPLALAERFRSRARSISGRPPRLDG